MTSTKMHYLLFYEVGEDYVSRRAQFREAHLKKAWKASEQGELVLGGALANPVDGAVLLFSGRSPDVAEKFARDDPYVTSGLVKRWYVREWSTVVGIDAANPLCLQAAEAAVEQGLASTAKPMPAESGTILRMWKARSTVEKVGEYVEHATKKVFPMLRKIEGHRGAYLLRRALDGALARTRRSNTLGFDDGRTPVCRRRAGEGHSRAGGKSHSDEL
jgi:uncharacterized protein YciI